MISGLFDSPRRLAMRRASRRMRQWLRWCRASGAMTFSLVMGGCASPRSASLPYSFALGEEEAVREILTRDSTWRLAVEADSRNAAAISSLRASDAAFTPYFTRDTSRAGRISVAFVLTRGSEFRVFYMRADGADALRVDEVATLSWLDDGFVRLRGDSLDIALFNSGEIVSFIWDPATGNMVLLPEDPPEDSTVPPVASRPPPA